MTAAAIMATANVDPIWQQELARFGVEIVLVAFTTDEVLLRAIERFTIGLMATGAVGGLQTAAA